MKQFGNPPPLLREPPFQLTPLFLSNFLMTLLFVQISKMRYPLILGGRKLCAQQPVKLLVRCYLNK